MPVAPQAKRPTLSGWTDLRLSEAEIGQVFDDSGNVGILLGEPSQGLVDVDLDCKEARDVARELLPKTGMVHGRRSAPASHYWYTVDDPPRKTIRHLDKQGGTIVELRSTGGHTIAPPSLHPSGERIQWVASDQPGRVSRAELEGRVRKIAAAVVLIRKGYARGHALQLVSDPGRPEMDPEALAILRPKQQRKVNTGPDRTRRSDLTDEILRRGDVYRVLSLLGIDAEGKRFACPISDHKSNDRSKPFVPEGPLWNCHACDEGGNTITLVERIQRVSYQDARSWLAMALGVTRDRGEVKAPPPPTPQEERPWEETIPLTAKLGTAFPVESLPGWLRDWVEAEAEETQTPTDLAGMLALAACSAALQKKFRVSIRGQWSEPLNLYVVVVSPPGTRKSAVFAHATAPVVAWEADQRDRGRMDLLQAKEQIRRLESKLERKRRAAAQEDSDEKAEGLAIGAAHLARELEELKGDLPPDPRMVFGDITPERLTGVLQAHGERAALFSAEGGLFEILAGRYQGRPNLDLVLQAHSGDRVSVERMGRSETLEDPSLVIGLAVQPDVIERLGAQREFHGRGLLARFLYSIPRSNVGFRKAAPPLMPASVRGEYERRLRALLELQGEHTLQLSPEAAEVLVEKMEAIELALRPEGEFSPIVEWSSKLTGQILRLAGILWIAKNAGQAYRGTIDVETLLQAVELGRYAAAHARLAHQIVGAEPELKDAQALLEWLRRKGSPTFTRREAQRGNARRFKRAAHAQAAIDVLLERGHVRRGRETTSGGEVYEVNPRSL